MRGDDPLLYDYKRIIGPHHFTPEDDDIGRPTRTAFSQPLPEDLSVISFPSCRSRKAPEDNAAGKDWVSERWAQTRLIGEIFSQTFVREVIAHLMDGGLSPVSPDTTPMFNKKRYPVVGWASPWSHRHMAYAAGLGSFGIHDFLNHRKRMCSPYRKLHHKSKLQPESEKTEDIHANCLHYQGIKCLRCKGRCPVDAISEEKAHDKEACMRRVASSIKYCNSNYHIFIYGCGLSPTGMPCESGIPEVLRRKA